MTYFRVQVGISSYNTTWTREASLKEIYVGPISVYLGAVPGPEN